MFVMITRLQNRRFVPAVLRLGAVLGLAGLVAGVGGGLSPVAPAAAERTYIDGIAAQVGQEIVLSSEVEEQLAVASSRFGLADSNVTRAREEVLQRIIDEKVIVQEARARGISVTDAEVNEAVNHHIDLIREQLGGEEEFQRELAKEGLTSQGLVERYRDEARRDLLYTRLIQREIVSKIEVTDAEVDEYYLKHKAEIPHKPGKVELAHIFIGFRPDDKTVAKAQARLDRIGSRLDSGESFAVVAKELSDDPGTRDKGGDLGWFDAGQLEEHLAAVAASLKPGETSKPFQVPMGVEILRLVERDSSRVHLQHIRVELAVNEEMRQKLHERAEEVRKLATGGKDFAALADQYSDDRESAAKGGSLGTFDDNELNPTIAGAVGSLAPGGLSEIVETEQGYHIFKVTKREGGGEYELAEIRDRLKNRIIEERAEARTQDWLAGIRANYFIRRADKEPARGATAPAPTTGKVDQGKVDQGAAQESKR